MDLVLTEIFVLGGIRSGSGSEAYLENRQGGGGEQPPRGRILLPKGRAIERAPAVSRAIFVYLFRTTVHENFVDLF